MFTKIVFQKFYVAFFSPCLNLFGWKRLFLIYENFETDEIISCYNHGMQRDKQIDLFHWEQVYCLFVVLN